MRFSNLKFSNHDLDPYTKDGNLYLYIIIMIIAKEFTAKGRNNFCFHFFKSMKVVSCSHLSITISLLTSDAYIDGHTYTASICWPGVRSDKDIKYFLLKSMQIRGKL
jgi:hypothetical protein